MKHIVFCGLVLGAVLLIWSCSDNSEDVSFDPRVSMKFFNFDSLVEVNDTLVYLDSANKISESVGKIIVGQIEKLDSALDNLRELGDTVSNPEYDSKKLTNDSLVKVRTTWYKGDSILSILLNKYLTAKKDIEAGKISVLEIRNIVNGKFAQEWNSDSTDIWRIPMDMNNDTTALVLTIGLEKDTIVIGYERVEFEDEKGRVIVQTSNYVVKSSTFDSDTVICKGQLNSNDCIDSETTIKFYF